jgi:membrane protein DedA with SNARE-associated domain
MKKYFKQEYILLALVAGFSFAIIFLLRFLWDYAGLPSSQEIISLLINFINTYGLWIVIVSAFLESLLLVGMYFPGTIIIFTTIAATGSDVERMLKVVLFASIGMLLGYTFDYILGRRGLSKVFTKIGIESEIEKLKQQVQSQGIFSGIFLYALPGFGSLLSTALGVMRFSFIYFLIFITSCILFWNTLWGVVGYFLGPVLLSYVSSKYFSLSVVAIWLVYFYRSGKFDEIIDQSDKLTPADDSNYKSSV